MAFTAAITSKRGLPIAIKDQAFERGFKGYASRNCWVTQALVGLRDINVQDAPPIMTDDQEAVEQAERNRWHREEIHGGNRFPMVAKEG